MTTLAANSSTVRLLDVCRCSQQVRDIPLERFRLPTDGRQWKSSARRRSELLLRLSTHANGDGTFLGRDGNKNYSPSMKRLQEHYAKRTLYRLMDELAHLRLLEWKREQNHYGRRIYEIKLAGCGSSVEEQVPNSRQQVPNSREQVPQLRTPSVSVPSAPPKEGKTYGAVAPNSTHVSIKTQQQKRYGIIGRLAGRAEFLLKRNAKLDRGDLAESLKDWAARSQIPYFWPSAGHSPIEQAIVIAEERLRKFPPARAIEPSGSATHRRAG
jgi:hypothetical protein